MTLNRIEAREVRGIWNVVAIKSEVPGVAEHEEQASGGDWNVLIEGFAFPAKRGKTSR